MNAELKENIAALKDSPYLKGLYRPMTTEFDQALKAIDTDVPSDFEGLFMCNSSNPVFKPRGYYSWFDGDGMVHGTRFQNGRAHYTNRQVITEELQKEKKAGRALYQGLFGKVDLNKPYGGLKDSSNTAIVEVDDKLLSMWHLSGTPYSINPATLATEGPFSFASRLNKPMAAHTKTDPLTGDLVMFSYNMYEKPYLSYMVANGERFHDVEIETPGPSFYHDIAITKSHSILIHLPFYWNFDNEKQKRRSLFFDREQPTRFGVIPRWGTSEEVQWFEAEPCYMYHVVNSWEDRENIVLTGCRIEDPTYDNPRAGSSPREGAIVFAPVFYRWIFNLKTGKVTEGPLDDMLSEFPCINQQYSGQKSRFSYHGRFGNYETILMDALIAYDTENDSRQVFQMPGGYFCNEPAFAPRMKSSSENDGYVLTYVTHEKQQGQLWIFDASDIAAGPVSRLQLPGRIPILFHGGWYK